MAESVILSDGTTNYEFVYNASTQPDFKVHYGLRVEAGDPDVLWHRPDDAPPRLVRMNNQPRTVFLTKDVYGDDWDDIMNTLAPIKRWVDGDDQQAARYHTVGDVDKIYLRIKLDGMTNYTDATVVYGNVDDSGSFYKPVDLLNKVATGVVVMLVVEPLGEGAPITLRNDLPSSPHFIEDSSGSGLADNWVNVNSATLAINSSNYLTGGASQQVNGNSLSGIASAAVTATAPQVVAYAWIRPFAGSVRFRVRDSTATPVVEKILADGDPNSVVDKTYINPTNGTTWYRVSYSGTLANNNPYLQILSNESSSGFLVDNTYLQTGTLTIPDAWSSTAAIQNRYDPTGTSAATRARINYLDVWGVPGDSAAAVDQNLDITAVTGTKNGYIIGKVTDGAVAVTSGIHWVDNSAISITTTSGTVSEPADANRSEGEYDRYTAAGSPTDATLRITVGSTFSDLANTLSVPRRIFLIARSSSTASTVVLENSATRFYKVTSTAASLTSANTWQLVDLGAVAEISNVAKTYHSTSSVDLIGKIATPASATFDIDAVLLIPAAADGFSVVGEYINGFGLSTSNNLYVLGSEKKVIFSQGVSDDAYKGVMWTCPPGSKMTRYIYTMIDLSGTNTHHLTDATTVTMTVYPRTRHLLGTL